MFSNGQLVELTITPDEGYKIDQITGTDTDDVLTGNTLKVKMDSNKRVEVSFTIIESDL